MGQIKSNQNEVETLTFRHSSAANSVSVVESGRKTKKSKLLLLSLLPTIMKKIQSKMKLLER